ncbi:helix-turn-helix domain-containing protein [Flavitalea flava]
MLTKRKDLAAIQEVRLFIEENFGSEIPVDSLCRKFGLNRTKLQEGFSQLTGLPVHSFISSLRMKKAMALLKETEESIKVIAMECGYKNVSSFTRAFTNYCHCSPSRFRAKSFSAGLLLEKSGQSDK